MKKSGQTTGIITDVRSISFIVPAWNEESVLGPTIDAIKNSTRQLPVTSEIIVVDDSSTDQTADIAVEHGARVVRVQHRQIAATRNAGALQAHGDMLFFVDADTLITEAVVKAALQSIQSGAVGGGCRFRFDGRIPLYARVLEAVAVRLYRFAGLAAGCFLFCTREAFEAVNGFDTQLYAAEEGAMSLALRRQGRFVILHECVTTSGRKLRTCSVREIVTPIARIILHGRRYLRNRHGMEIWYGDRRPDHN
ncbi:MAG: glycosyltransferase [Verrucomicrobiia bacterium]|jgi:glycosyltransferase involved in cell wall biosynthesis